MPLIDLSDLDTSELRSLLDSARRQGHAAQSYEILREMEARRHRGPRPKTLLPKRAARPAHTIALELGDPLERREEPFEDPGVDALPPITLADAPGREAPPPSAPSSGKPGGWAHWGALIFAFGLAGGVAGGWWAADYANSGAPRPTAAPNPVATAPAGIQVAALPPAAAPTEANPPVSLVPEPPPPPPAEAAPTSPPPSAAIPATATAANATATATGSVDVADSAGQEAPAAKPAHAAQPVASADATCGSAPTPADRTICADPKLRRLQTELRQAYAEALQAHQDRALLRQRELAWADARNGLTDPSELATLYRQRIEKLQAATADALKRR